MAGIVTKQIATPVAADGTFVAPGANTANGVATLRYIGATVLTNANILTVGDTTDVTSSHAAAIEATPRGVRSTKEFTETRAARTAQA
jgi:hypothetical protein